MNLRAGSQHYLADCEFDCFVNCFNHVSRVFHMQIKLLSSAGPFDGAFIDALAGLEAGLITNGLDPAMFTVSRAETAVALGDGEPIAYEYTVYAGSERYIAIMPNDLAFLDFLAECCTAIAAEEAESKGAPVPLPIEMTPVRAMSRFAEWLNHTA